MSATGPQPQTEADRSGKLNAASLQGLVAMSSDTDGHQITAPSASHRRSIATKSPAPDMSHALAIGVSPTTRKRGRVPPKDGRSTEARLIRRVREGLIRHRGGSASPVQHALITREIARDLNISRNTVRKVLRSGETSFSYEREVQPRPKLGRCKGEIDRLLTANVENTAREAHRI